MFVDMHMLTSACGQVQGVSNNEWFLVNGWHGSFVCLNASDATFILGLNCNAAQAEGSSHSLRSLLPVPLPPPPPPRMNLKSAFLNPCITAAAAATGAAPDTPP
jgi:hypothetical protein